MVMTSGSMATIGDTSVSASSTEMMQQTSATPAIAVSESQAAANTTAPSTDADAIDAAALIGGIVGGIVALLLVVGLIAFLVARNRRPEHVESNNDTTLQSVPSDASPSLHRTNYDSLALISPENNYNALPAVSDLYVKLSPNRTEYEIGDLKPKP
jgi:hypothetical protein